MVSIAIDRTYSCGVAPAISGVVRKGVKISNCRTKLPIANGIQRMCKLSKLRSEPPRSSAAMLTSVTTKGIIIGCFSHTCRFCIYSGQDYGLNDSVMMRLYHSKLFFYITLCYQSCNIWMIRASLEEKRPRNWSRYAARLAHGALDSAYRTGEA